MLIKTCTTGLVMNYLLLSIETYYCSKIGKEPSGSKNRYGAIGGMIRDVTSGMIAWPRCRGLEGMQDHGQDLGGYEARS